MIVYFLCLSLPIYFHTYKGVDPYEFFYKISYTNVNYYL